MNVAGDWAEYEDEPVEASGLMRVRCRGCCEAETLAVPHMVPAAVCEGCRRAGVRPGSVPLWRAQPDALVCFPMREGEKPRERSPHPAPEVVDIWAAVDAITANMQPPAPVRALAEMAREAGWVAEVRYARGTGVHGSTGRPTSLRHSFALRFGGHPLSRCEARAVYVRAAAGSGGWTWGSVWVWGPTVPFFGWCGVTELKTWLRLGGSVEPEWYQDVLAAFRAAEEAGRAQTEARKWLKTVCAEEGLTEACRLLGLEIEIAEVRGLTERKGRESGG